METFRLSFDVQHSSVPCIVEIEKSYGTIELFKGLAYEFKHERKFTEI